MYEIWHQVKIIRIGWGEVRTQIKRKIQKNSYICGTELERTLMHQKYEQNPGEGYGFQVVIVETKV